MRRRALATVTVACGLASVLVSAAPAFAVRRVDGSIRSDRVWGPALDPFLLQGRVVVEEGVTLTIRPGVRIIGGRRAALVVEGTLIAEGTADRPIVFKSRRDAVRWRGIRLLGDDDRRSRITHAIVENARSGILSRGNAPLIRNTVLHGNKTALSLNNPQARLAVEHNILRGNRLALTGKTRRILRIEENDFWNNRINILARPQAPYDCGREGSWEIHRNDIIRGSVNERFFSYDMRTPPGSGVSPYSVDAENNWWGTARARKVSGRFRPESHNVGARLKNMDHSPIADSSKTSWLPPGPRPDPDPQPQTHGDPGTISKITRPKHGRCYDELVRIAGRATGVLLPVESVKAALRIRKRNGCQWWNRRDERFVDGDCERPEFFRVDGLNEWHYDFPRALRSGRYLVFSKSNADAGFDVGRNRNAFTVR